MQLDRGDKVALVGRNGCGKTTLMRLIEGSLAADDGQVQTARGTRIGMLHQDPQLDGQRTLRREAEQIFAALADLHDQLDRVSSQMAEAEGEALAQLMKRYEQLEHRMQAEGGYAVDHKIDATLAGLGLEPHTFDVKVADLSGGQKARLALTKLLLSETDILLLDEPTNHLDIAGRRWLERFLREFNGAVLLVSHDRWLLDEVVDRIVELEHGKLHEYPGNYTAYREQRALRRLEQQRRHAKQQTYVRQQKQFIQRYKTGQRAKEARGRQKKLDRYIENEMVDQVQHERVMGLQLPPAPRSGDRVIMAADIGRAYGQNVLFRGVSLSVQRGQRIGIIGHNGCGKSTLARTLIAADPPDHGSVRLGTNVCIGYYRQTHEHLDDDDTPASYLQRQLPDTSEQNARDIAGAFLFSGDDQDKPFGVLSGGERTRAVLAGLVIGGHNLLVLDEPSNHLDIPSAERLEEALQQFDGTLLLITHDRMLLQDTVDELLIFEGGGRVRHFHGSYRDYLQSQSAPPPTSGNSTPASEEPTRQGKKSRSEPKPKKKTRKPKGKGSGITLLKQEDLEKRMMEAEAKLAELDQQLADPNLYRDKDRFGTVHEQRQKTAELLKPLEAEWLRRAEED